MNYIDIFSGCGGLAYGLQQSGWKALFAIEKSPDAFSTLEKNVLCNVKEIWPAWLQYSANDINHICKTNKKDLRSYRGSVMLVAGGPPCQGFSSAGKRNESDARNKLVDSYLEFVDLVKPEMIFFENVRGFTMPFTISESEQKCYSDYIVEQLKELPEKVQYVIVKEAGASVYSASKLATEDFPKFDVGQRSATSIARRLQDPLAELVKIDPQSIGVGQYQHDMNQKKLSEALSGVVEDCVNKVGVDLNTASASLLEYISGISKVIAKNIVAYREENGRFGSRNQLLKVAKLGPKAYEQCAGFMRITDGKNPLDATGVHPESYDATKKLLDKLGFTKEDVKNRNLDGISKKISNYDKLAEELGIGAITLQDIVKELEKPARDPREDMPKPILRSDVLEMKDLTPGMVLKGTVRNVIDFGAFVDIGVHQDGLVHISQMSDKFIKHPLEVVSVGDIVEVKVMSVDLKKQRIQLTMKL